MHDMQQRQRGLVVGELAADLAAALDHLHEQAQMKNTLRRIPATIATCEHGAGFISFPLYDDEEYAVIEELQARITARST